MICDQKQNVKTSCFSFCLHNKQWLSPSYQFLGFFNFLVCVCIVDPTTVRISHSLITITFFTLVQQTVGKWKSHIIYGDDTS
jgi:hypothetical protein